MYCLSCMHYRYKDVAAGNEMKVRIDVGHLYAEIIGLLDKIMAAPAPSNFNLRSILEKEKLIGTNFMDWYRNLRIVLRQEQKEFVLTEPFPANLPNNAPAAQRREHEKRCNDYLDISCLILATMSPELQRQYEALDAHTIITGLCLQKVIQTLAELHGMLKTAEESIKKNSNHVMVMHKHKPNNKKSGQKRKLNSDEITSTSNSKTKGLKRSRSLARGEVDIRVGNGARVDAVAVYLMRHKSESFEKFKEFQNELLGYALETAAFILNRVPSKSVHKTPYEIWTGKRPSLSFLKIWGYEVYVKRLQSDKLTPKSDKCFFVGYPKEKKGYYFYNREEGKVFIARHGVFLGKEFISRKDSGSMVGLEEIQETPENVSRSTQPQQAEQDVAQQVEQVVVEPVVEALASQRFERIRRTPARYALLTTGQHDILLLDNDEPTTYEETMVGPDSEKWLGAMKSEIESMHVNQVWNLVDPPDGFRQIQGVDYDETFSPVTMLKSIRIVLAIAAYFDYEIWQMDVKTAFLNGNLDEDVYMTQPKGFVDPQSAKKICKLQKSIYGLKQASRSWNIRFDEVVKASGFVKNEEEPCVYKKINRSALGFLILYVDDILLIGNDIPMLKSAKTSLKNSFSMKDLGEATYILGIRIYRDRSKRLIGLSQSTYINKMLKRFNMQDSKKGFLSMSHGINLGKNQCPQTIDEQNKKSVIPYASAIGSIMYAMLCTRPDVSYALSATSRYQLDPGESRDSCKEYP
uniref:OSJNBa0029L02.4 protein n=1 Tax=Oryza sativa subsp. japonica TaxID=39947 RepID=Q7XMT3_ORYSJ|nr:OSJNBa0029L02.4 [Oryza sativa Japonica Group]